MKSKIWIAALVLLCLGGLADAQGAQAAGKLSKADCWFKAPDKISTRCYHLSVPESRAGRSNVKPVDRKSEQT